MPTDVIDFVHETTLADVPVEAIAFGRRCLLDLIGVAAAGSTTELAAIIRRHATEHFAAGSRSAPLWFDGREVSPAGAALANGMTIDAIDAHDGHNLTKGHTGCHQLPTLMAMTAAEGLDDPEDFVAALVVGYEFATRAGVALHATASDYHTSGAWGAVGSAALGARALGLDRAATWHALGIAEYHGPRSQMMRVIDHPTMLKDGSGWGAMAGVAAAYLAADGFTGAPAVTVNDPALAHVWDDLGARWVIGDQYFKPHPVCRWAQPAVEAALQLRRLHGIDAADLESVRVETFHEAARLATVRPASTEEAQYSLPFPIAAALVRGQLAGDEVSADALADTEIRRVAELVEIVEDDAHNAAFPHRRFARVALRMVDGTSVTSEDTEPRGDSTAHLSQDEIVAKFHQFASPVVGPERSVAIGAAIDADPLDLTGLRALVDQA